MTRIERIAKEVAALSPDELQDFRAWFQEFDARRWDADLERDVAAGALDALADNALDDHRAGRTKPL
ncbi:MAG TPA: hypothetical protein VGA77_17015 [Propylenella sp.]